ncbi:tRNA(m5U54)methyltransferase [Xylographa soralifera]|nr:tRNA(m5U54)methyltransferase [Xylographa soralifera]
MTKREAQHDGQKSQTRKITKKARLAIEGSFTEVLSHDVRKLLANRSNTEPKIWSLAEQEPKVSLYTPPERFTEIEVRISALSSTGDGLGLSENSDHVYVVPFTVPGDVVQVKVVNYFASDHYTLTDFVKVLQPSLRRDDTRVKCQYFSRCSGCQFQMLSYDDQLSQKKTIIESAYKNFSNLPSELVPKIGATIGSPLQYGYRTKLTPHFDGPPGRHGRGPRKDGTERQGFTEVPPIGFMLKGMRRTIDIEDCPIGTDAVRLGMVRERARVANEISTYKRGATILLRESTTRKPLDSTEAPQIPPAVTATQNGDVDGNINGIDETSKTDLSGMDLVPPNTEAVETTATGNNRPIAYEEKSCITDSNAVATEYIDSFVFHNTAGSFFQNNNSILPRFTAYIRDHILPPNSPSEKPIRYLIDAYCGSGLFTVTLSSLFSASTGIDISSASIASAHQNAKANNIDNATFMAADASALFAEVAYPSEETVVVIDPPRKGCDDNFLRQLLHFGPRRVVYVSCNVHTQARDVGVLVEGKDGCRYSLASLRGFDFFPQTSHVEGVAILNRVGELEKEVGAEVIPDDVRTGREIESIVQ